jgi:hypothetical protein
LVDQKNEKLVYQKKKIGIPKRLTKSTWTPLMYFMFRGISGISYQYWQIESLPEICNSLELHANV